MSHFQYLALLVGCLVVTVPLEFAYGFRVWRNPQRLARVLVPGLVIFMLWDAAAIHRGHWTYNDHYLSDVRFGSLPLEEALFFVIVPTAAISGYEAVRAGLRNRHG